MKFTKPISAIVLAFMGIFLSAPAQAQFNYRTNGGTITIVRYTGSGDIVSIPSTINGRQVTSIGAHVFDSCKSPTTIIIPDGVTSIGKYAFDNCFSLTNVTISSSVTSIGSSAFDYCTSLIGIYFQGDQPKVNGILGYLSFSEYIKATVYYLSGTKGWGPTFGGCPTAVWNQQGLANVGNPGILLNQFGFTITGASNMVVVVEASTNLGKAD